MNDRADHPVAFGRDSGHESIRVTIEGTKSCRRDSMFSILRYENLPPRYVEYDPAAPRVAARVASLVEQAASWSKLEHIGSTAAPDCAGKGIVDLMAMYPPGRLAEMKDVLERLNFQRQTAGHAFPEERPMRVGAIEFEGHFY